MYIVLFHPFNRFYIHFPRSREHEILVSLSIMGVWKNNQKSIVDECASQCLDSSITFDTVLYF